MNLTAIPEQHRDLAALALKTSFGDGVEAITSADGGASVAHKYRVDTSTGPHLLRMEAAANPLKNPHQYAALQAAADAAIAPPVRYVDAEQGVVVMEWIDVVPLADFPGGAPARARAVGELLARLHAIEPVFGAHGDYLDNIVRLLGYVAGSDPLRAGLEQIRAAYPWQPDEFVSCHNDPNEFNILFDGSRLWLIDWETATRNDPYIDMAVACQHSAPTRELADLLIAGALGRAADDRDRARLVLAGQLTRLFAGSILLVLPGIPEAVTDFAKGLLGQFQSVCRTDEFADALGVLQK